MKEYFQSIVKELFKNIQSDEFLIINFDAEESSFVRLNKGKIRQPGSVKQISVSLSLSNREKRKPKILYKTKRESKKRLSNTY